MTAATFEIYRKGKFSEDHYNQSGTYFVHSMDQEWDEQTWTLGTPLNWGNVKYVTSALASGTFKQYQSPEAEWYSFDVVNAFTSSSIDDVSEKGFLFRAQNEIPFWGSGGRVLFASSDTSSNDQRPKLTLTYKSRI